MTYELFEVGGKIRDELLGLKSKDIDYAVVLSETDNWTAEEGYKWLYNQLKSEGYEIFLPSQEDLDSSTITTSERCLTIRAMFPKDHVHSGVADFVLARHEVGYMEGTRTPITVLGTLKEDLERRDFTLNTLARDSNGTLIDMFDGERDLMNGILRTPLDAAISFNNDPLRIIRGLRFKVTKGFEFSDEVIEAIRLFNARKMEVVSTERIMDELNKMLRHSTTETLDLLSWLRGMNPSLYFAIMLRGMRFEVTNKK